MATNKLNVQNIDNSDLVNYPNGRIRDNSGAGDGTPVNRLVYGDLHEFFAKLMRLANMVYSGLPDNETNGYQLIDALIQLATKNDFIYNVTSVSGVLNIGLNLANVKDGEILIAKASNDLASETQIKGSGPTTLTISASSSFKANDYLRLIKTNVGITIVRLADADNIDALVLANNYLKAATESEEFAGLITTKSTTPYTNQLAFARRVIGLDSGMFLATQLRNGLLSKEDKQRIDSFANPVKNIGWFSGLDPGAVEQIGVNLPRSGNIVSAQVYSASAPAGESLIRVILANPMPSLDYYVRMCVESEGNPAIDNDAMAPIFKKETTTQFVVSIREVQSSIQNLKIHIEVVQI